MNILRFFFWKKLIIIVAVGSDSGILIWLHGDIFSKGRVHFHNRAEKSIQGRVNCQINQRLGSKANVFAFWFIPGMTVPRVCFCRVRVEWICPGIQEIHQLTVVEFIVHKKDRIVPSNTQFIHLSKGRISHLRISVSEKGIRVLIIWCPDLSTRKAKLHLGGLNLCVPALQSPRTEMIHEMICFCHRFVLPAI